MYGGFVLWKIQEEERREREVRQNGVVFELAEAFFIFSSSRYICTFVQANTVRYHKPTHYSQSALGDWSPTRYARSVLGNWRLTDLRDRCVIHDPRPGIEIRHVTHVIRIRKLRTAPGSSRPIFIPLIDTQLVCIKSHYESYCACEIHNDISKTFLTSIMITHFNPREDT